MPVKGGNQVGLGGIEYCYSRVALILLQFTGQPAVGRHFTYEFQKSR